MLAGRLLFGLASLVLFAASFWWYDLGEPWTPFTSSLLAALAIALHLALVGRRASSLDPVVWAPMAIFLFYFGMAVVIDWLGIHTRHGYDAWEKTNAPYLARGFCVALFSLVSFLWGIHLAGLKSLGGGPNRSVAPDRSLGVTSLVYTLGAMAMVALGIAIVGPGTVFGFYGDWWDAKRLGVDQRWIDMGIVFAEAGVFALLASDEPGARWRRWFAYLCGAIIAVIAVQKGDRSALIALGVGAGWCYTQRIAKLRWSTVMSAAFMTLLVMPVIAEWRSQRSLEESKRSGVSELLGSSLYNMGSSVNAIVFTVDFVPRLKPFEWGTSFRYSAVSAIPNLGLTKGKSFADAERIEEVPSSWLTSAIAPGWFASGGGYGFAMAAEWYYNYGFPGVWLGMALTGWLLTRARNASTNSTLALVWSTTLFAGVVIWVRNIIGYPLKIAVWPIIGIWVIDLLIRSMRSRSVRRPAVASDATPASPT